MILRYYGHAFFTLSLENDTVIAFDPYGNFYDYPQRNIKADLCLVSHHHHDHDGLSCLQPGAVVIDQPGVHAPLDGVIVRGISTWHDEVQGAKRGPNTIFIVESEGLRIAHAGDLGHMPDVRQIKQLGHIDVLLLPVGGYYTIDPQTALEVCRMVQPRVVVPMHYRTEYDPEMPICELRDFLMLLRAEDSQLPLMRIAKADISERPQVVTLKIQ